MGRRKGSAASSTRDVLRHGPDVLGDREWVFDQPFFFILNLALGGLLGGRSTPTSIPIQYYVDYVRVYQPISDG